MHIGLCGFPRWPWQKADSVAYRKRYLGDVFLHLCGRFLETYALSVFPNS